MTDDTTQVDHTDECDCAPSAREQRALWPDVSRRALFGAGALGIVAVGAVASGFSTPAFAADYPSWADVQAAKNNEAAKQSEITKINGLISQLNTQVTQTQAAADQASQVFYTAQQAFFDASQKAADIQDQADKQSAAALEAANQAGRLAAQLYRSGGDNASLQIFFAGSAAGANDLLARLGTMDRLLQRNNDVYTNAVTAQNLAQSLSDQAKVQADERDKLQQQANDAMTAAQNAAQAAQAALANQQSHLQDLQAQLQALQDQTAKTVADYQAGVEAARKAAEAAAAAAAAAAAKAAQEAAQGGGGGGGGGASSSGWARPANGPMTSPYGPRYAQCGPSYCASSFHYGLDIANGTCGFPIFAASAGTVVHAGPNGGYGNYVKIDHGGGIGTGYAHMQNGGILVSYGQQVSAGQVIGRGGETGNAFGCHLHFEFYVNGSPKNPQPLMAQRGINI
ncbi:MAG: M23 family metallopeptidase [Microbacterium ginsengisoli]|uniref:M23 family metallopeptidase n=1 Tax=Microbacterium TaxID=33882 RepID=UPI0007021845|nr:MULTISPECIES: M23 family metallopeptidase [unclassified Microbacterium]MBN9197882.1 M23 family metallopeptidase [Microbacterium ginsengisoli]KQR91644.1 peptidase M23 [Microbacterium sp. Leaf347]KQR91726.1 peptidase M23 [Microbacterium sp. Leaf351]ODU79106.1 MAG: peptidase M23 [Microbacterium sp. SCN 71-21]OJU79228.1 MAG: peptidase M23 [Microbacterium sp. 71-23]